MNIIRKKDGFKDELYFIIPTEAFSNYANHPLIRGLYLTDVGYFPKALNHFRERTEGVDEYIFFYCVEGEGIINVNNKEYKISQNEIFCIPKNQKHIYYAKKENPWSIFWIHFKGDNTKYFPLETPEIIKLNSKTSNDRMIFLFDLLSRVLEKNYTEGNFIYISQVLSLILSEAYLREKADKTNNQNKNITLIIRYMYQNINKKLTLEDICSEFNFSKSYINLLFTKYANKSPIDFFITLKMQEACKLLKLKNLNVLEVSIEMGYSDPYYFSRIFKKFVGISPKKYKQGEYIFYKSID